ncbi:MAG: SIMPL domain-containing protein, partial [Lachnospiraceae bacterium]|nr:SIMPL domain-containing protein [Lachnospiraceae bacterium]
MKMNQKQLLALGISMMLGTGMLTGCAAAADSSLSKATGQGNAAAGSTSADASDAGTEADEGTSAADAGATKTDSAANIDAGVDSGHTTISAEASDYVMASPDQASVNFSIETTAKTAKDAQSQNAKQMEALIGTLSGLGVGEDAIYTPDYSLYPTYDNYGNNIVGYKVSSTLAVKDQSIDEMEKLIAGCTDAGVTSISGVNYYYSGYS